MLNNGELWLRAGQPGATRFDVFFDAANGDGALFKAEIAPSQFAPAQVTKWPSDLLLWGLRGRGLIETEDGASCVLGPTASVRIPKNAGFSWLNELREVWSILCFLPNGGAAGFLDSLPMCEDDVSLIEEAAAYSLSLHLPPLEPALPEPIRALENRIFWPQAAGFAL
jgi:hypothetical protein